MKIIMLDVDETLDVSGGKITFTDCLILKTKGYVLGLCGNYAAVTMKIPYWHHFFNILGSFYMSKADFLTQIKNHVPAEEYIMIGNTNPSNSPFSDRDEALKAGWKFIDALDFDLDKF
jgi:hypothetical protein